MALAAKTARFALGRTIIDAQFLADSVVFMNSKCCRESWCRRWSRYSVSDIDHSETTGHVFPLKLSTLFIIGNDYSYFIYFLLFRLVYLLYIWAWYFDGREGGEGEGSEYLSFGEVGWGGGFDEDVSGINLSRTLRRQCVNMWPFIHS